MQKNNDATKKRRWEQLQTHHVNFPLIGSVATISTDEPVERSASKQSSFDYPQLRILLRDRGLAFGAKYNQAETARIIGVSDRTVRDWTHAGKMPCCYYPSGRPYYRPQNIEDYLTACESPRPSKAAR